MEHRQDLTPFDCKIIVGFKKRSRFSLCNSYKGIPRICKFSISFTDTDDTKMTNKGGNIA